MSRFIDSLSPMTLWLAFGVTAVLLVLLVAALVIRRRRGKSALGVLRTISYDLLNEIVVPKADEGEIQIEYTLLTPSGILVVETKDVEGVVFASDRMDDWTVIAGNRRYTFANPQPTLYDRVAAIAQIVKDVPVTGVILFPAAADFSKGRPRHVTTLDGLLEEFPRLGRSADRSEIAAYLPHWERLRDEAVSASAARIID
ncbi:MAG: nuclease-related domain-containing protein [Gammaproteobacteria bacterium]|jgi:hypothetical protein